MLVLQSALAVPLFDHMFWTNWCTAFFGILRVSEFTCSGVFVPGRHLGFDDIERDAAGHYRLFLHTSKTDPFHHGCTILLGPSGHQVCPVAAMSRYLAIRGSTPGPLFICANGTPLSPSMVNAWLRSILKGAGVPGNYSRHGFRIGAAMSAALAGVLDRVIRFWVGGLATVMCGIFARSPPSRNFAGGSSHRLRHLYGQETPLEWVRASNPLLQRCWRVALERSILGIIYINPLRMGARAEVSPT